MILDLTRIMIRSCSQSWSEKVLLMCLYIETTLFKEQNAK